MSLSKPQEPVFEVYGGRSRDGRINVGTKMNGAPTDLICENADEEQVRVFVQSIVEKYGTPIALSGEVAAIFNSNILN